MTLPEPDMSRKQRYGTTRKKNLTITEFAHGQIQGWADEKGVNFSTAIESLALIGLGRETAETLPLLVANLLERILARQSNRFAKLISLAVIAAEEANWKADALLLQVIRQEAHGNPERFAQKMAVSTDPQDRLAAQIRRMRDEMKSLAHESAIRRLKRPQERVKPEQGDDEVNRD